MFSVGVGEEDEINVFKDSSYEEEAECVPLSERVAGFEVTVRTDEERNDRKGRGCSERAWQDFSKYVGAASNFSELTWRQCNRDNEEK